MHRPKWNPLAGFMAAWVLAALAARGQTITPPIMAATGDNPPGAPLLRAGEVKPAPGGWVMREAAAERARQLGFSPAAEAVCNIALSSLTEPEVP